MRVGEHLGAWVFEAVPQERILVLAYACTLVSTTSSLRASTEHSEVRFIALSDLAGLALPDVYRAAIARRGRESETGPRRAGPRQT